MEPIGFGGKIVVVTGGSSGIGRATATAFAAYGASVTIIDVNVPADKIIAQENIAFRRADVSNAEEMMSAAEYVTKRYGHPADILVSNAGIENNMAGNLLSIPEEILKNILEVNLMGALPPKMCIPKRFQSVLGSRQ